MKKLPASTTLREARKAGRAGDTELVHLNQAEVDFLENMTGGHGLTINPQTGEKEAFLPFLLSMLPALFPGLAASLGAATGVSALASPLVLGALGSGLGTWAETGDLGKGVMAGLGGAALGGIGGQLLGGMGGAAGDLAAKGLGAAAPTAAALGGEAAKGFAQNAVGDFLNNGLAGAVAGGVGKGALTQAAASGLAKAGMGQAATGMLGGLTGMIAPALVGMPGEHLSIQDQMDVGETDQAKRKKAAILRAQQENFMAPRSMNAAPGGYRHGMDKEFNFFTPGGTLTPVTTQRGFADGGLVEMLTPFSPMLSLMRGEMPFGIAGLLDMNKPGTPESRREEERLAGQAPKTFAMGGPVGPQVMPMPPGQPAMGKPQGPEVMPFAPGPPRQMMAVPRPLAGNRMAMAQGNPNIGLWAGLSMPPRQVPTAYDPMSGGGYGRAAGGGGGYLGDTTGVQADFTGGYNPMQSGLMPRGPSMPSTMRHLGVQGFADGGMVMGPGDGTSDEVPAVINGAEPAALSDGEFVIPAMAVAKLGNGSSKAGAEKLQQMVNSLLAAQ